MTHPAHPSVVRAMAALKGITVANWPMPIPVARLLYHALDELEIADRQLGEIDEDLPNSLRRRVER